MNDSIDESMFEQKLTGLKTIGQVDLACGLHDTRAGKSDKSIRLSDHDITQ